MAAGLKRFAARATWPRPDFAVSGLARPRAALLLLAVAAIALAVSAGEVWTVQRAQREAQARLDRAQERIAQARRGVRAPPLSADDARARVAATALVQEIDHGWSPVLLSIEKTTPASIAWLALAHDAKRRQLRLEGIAKDQAQALALVEALTGDGAWQDVVLGQIGNADSAGGMRFVVTARRSERGATP